MPFPPRNILVGTDFSAGAQQAADAAVALARMTGASVTLAHAVPLGAYVDATDASVRSHQEVHDLVGERVKAHLAREAERIAWEGGSLKVVSADGPAGQELSRIATAEGCDLVVVGSHGRTGLRRMLAGSVAEAVVRHCPTDVWVVRTRE